MNFPTGLPAAASLVSIRTIFTAVMLLGLGSEAGSAEPLGLVLPTPNDAIFSDDPSKFYMYTDRTFEGVVSKPWSGGRYGLTRDQKRTDAGIVFTKFHEGIDIQPVKRDGSGEPLDDIFSMADGKVVYVSAVSGHSNYGKYLVIEHDKGEGPFYSLYAHLHSAAVETGQAVKAGQRIARMGYTGDGINKTRAHVHVEVALMISSRFQDWYDLHLTSKNWHGNYSGYNLIGIDVAGLLHSHRDNPAITLAEFIQRDAPYYKVVTPSNGVPEILARYPWLGQDMDQANGNPSWEFTFNHLGVPLAIAPSRQDLTYPAVSWVRPSQVDHAYNTSARISGNGDKATLTASGTRFIQLISSAF